MPSHAPRRGGVEGGTNWTWVKPRDPFLASWRAGRGQVVFSRHMLRKRFRTACKVLGPERLRTRTIHHGRHTFISHALAGNKTFAEVRDAARHANRTVTSGYLPVAVDTDAIGRLFARNKVGAFGPMSGIRSEEIIFAPLCLVIS